MTGLDIVRGEVAYFIQQLTAFTSSAGYLMKCLFIAWIVISLVSWSSKIILGRAQVLRAPGMPNTDFGIFVIMTIVISAFSFNNAVVADVAVLGAMMIVVLSFQMLTMLPIFWGAATLIVAITQLGSTWQAAYIPAFGALATLAFMTTRLAEAERDAAKNTAKQEASVAS